MCGIWDVVCGPHVAYIDSHLASAIFVCIIFPSYVVLNIQSCPTGIHRSTGDPVQRKHPKWKALYIKIKKWQLPKLGHHEHRKIRLFHRSVLTFNNILQSYEMFLSFALNFVTIQFITARSCHRNEMQTRSDSHHSQSRSGIMIRNSVSIAIKFCPFKNVNYKLLDKSQ